MEWLRHGAGLWLGYTAAGPGHDQPPLMTIRLGLVLGENEATKARSPAVLAQVQVGADNKGSIGR
jgi:hypothetical protein